jgi:hypothetical protein
VVIYIHFSTCFPDVVLPQLSMRAAVPFWSSLRYLTNSLDRKWRHRRTADSLYITVIENCVIVFVSVTTCEHRADIIIGTDCIVFLNSERTLFFRSPPIVDILIYYVCFLRSSIVRYQSLIFLSSKDI